MEQGKTPTGTMECADYTRGHHAPITISRLGPWEAWWGRKDIAIYIVFGLLFFPAVLVVRSHYGTFWNMFGTETGTIVMLFFMLGIPIAAGFFASVAGLKIRDWPVIASSMLATLHSGFYRGGIGQDGPVRRERKVKLRARTRNGCWDIPERER